MKTPSDRTTYRCISAVSALFWTSAAVLCWMTTSTVLATIFSSLFLTFAVASVWMLRTSRFCDECGRRPVSEQKSGPSALCPYCGNVTQSDQYQLGRPGQIDLTGQDAFAHPQPICRAIALIVALGVRDRANEIVLDPDGSIRMQIDDGDTFDMAPMPPHLVHPIRNLFKTLMKRTSISNKPPTTSQGELEVIVPLETGDQTTVRGHIRFSPLHKAERMIVQLDKLRREHVVCYPSPST